MINNISNMDDVVINRNIDEIIARVEDINTVRNTINDNVLNLIKNTNMNPENVQNYIKQIQEIRNSQTETNRSTVTNRTSNIVNLNQQIQNLNQELINKITKTLLLQHQNTDTENTRRNIRTLKDKLRKLNRTFNREINNPVSELRNTLNQNQHEINRLTESEANGEINPATADRMRNRLSNENDLIRKQMVREHIPEVDYDSQLSAQINFMKNEIPRLEQAGSQDQADAAKVKLVDLLKEQERSQVNAIREFQQGLTASEALGNDESENRKSSLMLANTMALNHINQIGAQTGMTPELEAKRQKHIRAIGRLQTSPQEATSFAPKFWNMNGLPRGVRQASEADMAPVPSVFPIAGVSALDLGASETDAIRENLTDHLKRTVSPSQLAEAKQLVSGEPRALVASSQSFSVPVPAKPPVSEPARPWAAAP